MTATASLPLNELDDHAWLDRVHRHADGLVLVLSDEGLDALRRCGKMTLLQALQVHSPALTVRLLDRFEAARGFDIGTLLHSPLPRAPLPIIRHIDGDTHTITLHVPVDLAHFPGHFAAAPVVPGIVQVAWALELAAVRLGTCAQCRTMEALKFQQLLRPGADAELTLRADRARGKLHFAYRHGDANFSSGRLVWSTGP
ncbi:MAG TPA: hypothetical protein VIM98_19405 [Dyella sp.]|uniref:ApeI family dehydratase n=1 Tax=Dyella sp. TaxID=1869338 RepID=UPI002F948497